MMRRRFKYTVNVCLLLLTKVQRKDAYGQTEAEVMGPSGPDQFFSWRMMEIEADQFPLAAFWTATKVVMLQMVSMALFCYLKAAKMLICLQLCLLGSPLASQLGQQPPPPAALYDLFSLLPQMSLFLGRTIHAICLCDSPISCLALLFSLSPQPASPSAWSAQWAEPLGVATEANSTTINNCRSTLGCIYIKSYNGSVMV